MATSNPPFAKSLVWVNGAVPGAILLWDAAHHRLGANPVNFAIRTTGLLSLIFLVGSLFVTPIRQLSGWNALYPHRRTLGLYAAFYAFSHFAIFFWWDRERSVESTLHEIVARRYIWFGMLALLIFVPLTLTSTQGMIARLGPTRWKWLHRLVYVAAIGGAVHYLLLNKLVTTQSIVFASVIGALLIHRDVASHVIASAAEKKLKATLARAPVANKKKFWKGKLRVIETVDETPEVRTLKLAATDGQPLPFDYRPGQYLNLMLTVDGQPVNRSYTIASSPTRMDHCELTVKREEMGTSSRHLHRTVQVGDELSVSAPAGKFTFDGVGADSIVLIAGGVGITPLMSKVRFLTDVGWHGDMFLILSARGERDIIFRDELAFLAKRHPNLHVTITLSRAADDWTGERGRISPELLRRVIPNLESRRFHLCGPTEMTDATTAMLIAIGVPATQIESESFTPAGRMQDVDGASATAPVEAASPAASDGATHVVTFERSGKTADVPPDQNLLEAAEAAGVSIDFDCRSGICGQCKTRLLTGNVTMAVEDALTAADRAGGVILACQATCVGDVTLDA